MIILKIRFIPKPEMSIEDGANFLRDNFPASRKNNALVSVGIIAGTARDDDHFICLKLRQDELTERQRDYLHLDPFAARYVDSFEVDTNPIELDFETKPILASWEVETFREIVENKPCVVPSNGTHTRFYTEPVHERQWRKLHHLIDVDGTAPMYSEIVITEFSEDGTATQVTLTHNEVDDLLTVLLQRQITAAKESYENLMRVKRQESTTGLIDFKSDDDSIDSLEDHPF